MYLSTTNIFMAAITFQLLLLVKIKYNNALTHIISKISKIYFILNPNF